MLKKKVKKSEMQNKQGEIQLKRSGLKLTLNKTEVLYFYRR